jgi:hypothetical protein
MVQRRRFQDAKNTNSYIHVGQLFLLLLPLPEFVACWVALQKKHTPTAGALHQSKPQSKPQCAPQRYVLPSGYGIHDPFSSMITPDSKW